MLRPLPTGPLRTRPGRHGTPQPAAQACEGRRTVQRQRLRPAPRQQGPVRRPLPPIALRRQTAPPHRPSPITCEAAGVPPPTCPAARSTAEPPSGSGPHGDARKDLIGCAGGMRPTPPRRRRPPRTATAGAGPSEGVGGAGSSDRARPAHAGISRPVALGASAAGGRRRPRPPRPPNPIASREWARARPSATPTTSSWPPAPTATRPACS